MKPPERKHQKPRSERPGQPALQQAELQSGTTSAGTSVETTPSTKDSVTTSTRATSGLEVEARGSATGSANSSESGRGFVGATASNKNQQKKNEKQVFRNQGSHLRRKIKKRPKTTSAKDRKPLKEIRGAEKGPGHVGPGPNIQRNQGQ